MKNAERGSNADIFLKSIEKMRRAIPNLTLRTSFIVGFPGESVRDFEVLCDFVRAAEFDWMGAFAYSDEINLTALDAAARAVRTIGRQGQSAVADMTRNVPGHALYTVRDPLPKSSPTVKRDCGASVIVSPRRCSGIETSVTSAPRALNDSIASPTASATSGWTPTSWLGSDQVALDTRPESIKPCGVR